MQIESEPYLLQTVEEALKSYKEDNEAWEFRAMPTGTFYWTGKDSKATSEQYPYLDEMKNDIDQARRDAEQIKNSAANTASRIVALPGIAPEKSDGVRRRLRDEARLLVNRILQSKISAKENQQPTYNLSQISELVGRKLTKEEALYFLFACPFELDNKQEEQIDSSESEQAERPRTRGEEGRRKPEPARRVSERQVRPVARKVIQSAANTPRGDDNGEMAVSVVCGGLLLKRWNSSRCRRRAGPLSESSTLIPKRSRNA